MSEVATVSRRQFLKTGATAAGGLLIGFYLPPAARAISAIADTSPDFMPNAFVRISPGGAITVIVGKAEMGQGVYTSLPMILAEELDADWTKVGFESAPVAPAYNHTVFGIQMTGGSTSVWTSYDQLRKAGAAARAMLVQAAAATWDVDTFTCRTENGFVIQDVTKARLSYGELASKAAAVPLPTEVKLKDPSEFRILGKPLHRLDTPAKCNGAAEFGIDVSRPGMFVALIERPPVFGAKAVRYNSDKAREVKGVRAVVGISRGIAVVADGYWAARKGRELLEVKWSSSPLDGYSTARQRADYAKLAETPGAVARNVGTAAQAMSGAAVKLDVVYEAPYLAHATMEPMNCVADVRADSCEVWMGSQFQTMDRLAAAEEAGLHPDQVQLHTTFLGGGFGRRAVPDCHMVREAVQVSRAVKAPVKVIWTREDDMRGGYYRPFWYHRISGGLDAAGKLNAWSHTIVGQSVVAGSAFEKFVVKDGVDETSVEGAADIPYEIPNIRVELHTPALEVPTLWWRSVGHSHTAFVVESFMDEMAHAAHQDPYEFRRALLAASPRHLGVLELVAEKSGWGKPLPDGHARGIAVHDSFGSYAAHVVEVSVSPQEDVRVHRVVCAVDCGPVVNPDTIKAQLESGVVFGLTAALKGQITIENGRVQQSNFHDYPMMRIQECPVIEPYIVESNQKQGGLGEPGVPPVAPALANAIFAATGKRVRRLPILPESIRSAS
jgi:isoquinoline 1-oxidoreductase beta subunit